MISHGHRAIFIHIPKTAGTSVEAALGNDDDQDHRTLRELHWRRGGLMRFTSTSNLSEVANGVAHSVRRSRNPAIAITVSRAQFRSYFKFTVVRNPWDRAFSWYKNVLRDSFHRERLGAPVDVSFRDFIERYSGVDLLRSQLHWIVDFKGDIGVDFICRFESLDKDFVEVSRRIGLACEGLPHLLPSEGPHYTTAYDEWTRRLVGERYRHEIELLGYSFD